MHTICVFELLQFYRTDIFNFAQYSKTSEILACNQKGSRHFDNKARYFIKIQVGYTISQFLIKTTWFDLNDLLFPYFPSVFKLEDLEINTIFIPFYHMTMLVSDLIYPIRISLNVTCVI